MNLEKAMTEVYDRWDQPAIINDDDYKAATNILIEAGKFIDRNRGCGAGGIPDLLPGETKD